MAEEVLVVEEDLKHLLLQTEKYQQDITDLTKLYQVANAENMQHMEELKNTELSLADVQSQNKQLLEENENYKELLRARDEQLLVLEEQIVKLAQENANLDSASLAGLISPTEGKDLNEQLEMIRQALNSKPEPAAGPNVDDLRAQLDTKQKELDTVTLECNRLKFEKQDQKIPDNAVIRQLEFRVEEQNEELTELKTSLEDATKRESTYDELREQFEQVNSELQLKEEELVEKESDILELIEEFEKLQDDNEELQEALENGINFAHNQPATMVTQLIQTDLAADNAVLEFESDFELMLEELQQEFTATGETEVTEIMQILSKGSGRFIVRQDLISELEHLIDEWNDLKNSANALEMSDFKTTTEEDEKDVIVMRLQDDNEVSAKEIQALKDEVDRQIDISAMKARDVAELRDEIVELNQQITARDVTIENEIAKIQEQEKVLHQTKEKLEQFEIVSEQLEKTQYATEEQEKIIPELKQENDGLKLMLEEVNQKMEATERLLVDTESRVAALETEMQQTQAEKASREIELNDELKTKSLSLDAQKTKISELEYEIEQFCEEKEDLQAHYDQLVDEAQQLKTAALRSENNLEEQQNMLTETNTASISYQQLGDELKQQNKALEVQIEKLRNDKEELLLKLSDLKLLKNELENDMKLQHEQSKEVTIELQNENQILQTQNNDFKEVLTSKNAEINELEMELRRAETEVKEIELGSKKSAGEHKKQLDDVVTQIAEAQKKVAEQDDGISRLTTKISELNDNLAVKEAMVAHLETQLAELQEQLAQREGDLKNEQIELERANVERKRIQQDLERTELEINEREENFLEQTELIKTKYEDFTEKQLDREIEKREAEITRLKESLDECHSELSMCGVELDKTRNQLRIAQNDIETLNIKVAQEEELNQRIRENAGELKHQQEEKISHLESELANLNQRYSSKEMESKLEEAERTAAVRDEYASQINALVQQIKDLQLENEKMKVAKQMEAVERGKLNQDLEVLKEKLVDAEAGFNEEIKEAEKYKELYKKAYDVVDKLKARESEGKKVIGNLEERIKAIESRKSGESQQLREKWGGGEW